LRSRVCSPSYLRSLLSRTAITQPDHSPPSFTYTLLTYTFFTNTPQVSQRGVVFFRSQSALTNDLQKALIQRLGVLAGKPSDSGLHIHPVLNSERELGGSDPEISTISSVQFDKLYKKKLVDESKQSAKNQSTAQWHSDIAFEPAPADYTSLRLTQLPRTGGGEFVILFCFCADLRSY